MEVFANLVGVTFRGADAKEIVKSLNRDSGDLLSFENEPDNPYDSHAVKVIHESTGTHIGYISRENNYEVFQAVKRGDPLNIQIVSFENTLKPTMLITDKVDAR
jgi:hypothetical protein